MFPSIQHYIDEYNHAFEDADPRSRKWLFISNSPIPVWIISSLYIGFVLVGPKIMKNRKPFQLHPLIVVYNMGLVALSLYMFVEIILSSLDANYGFFCSVYNKDSWTDPKETRVANVLWWYFFSKVIELNDTVLMVVRKKQNQVTFLHVFHHVSMMNIWWWVIMFVPGGFAIYGSCLNCLVHVVMYTYYGLSAIPALRHTLWWKRYITTFQLLQFMMTLSHTVYTQTMPCDFPKWGMNLLRNYMIIMIILFSNFYVHAYVLKRKSSHGDKSKMRAPPQVTDNCEMTSDVPGDRSKDE